MNEKVTLPVSVRQRLEAVQAMTENNQALEAGVMLKHAAIELAKVSPDMVAVLLAGSMGFTNVNAAVTDSEISTLDTKVTLFGFTIASGQEVRTTTKTQTKKLNLG